MSMKSIVEELFLHRRCVRLSLIFGMRRDVMKSRPSTRMALIITGMLCATLFLTCQPLEIKNTIVAAATADPVWISLDENGFTGGTVGRSANDHFGYAVDMSENYAIVGADTSPEGGSNRGAAYIYVKNSNGDWINPYKIISQYTGIDGRRFGAAVAITDTYAVVSSFGTNLIEIFTRNSGTWSKSDEITIPGATIINAIDIYGNKIIAADLTHGFARIYSYSGSWVLEDQINGDAGSQYGYSVSIYGNYAAVGAPTYSTSITNGGAVYIFQWSGIAWNPSGTVLQPITAIANEVFGTSICISMKNYNYLVVGGPGASKVYFYKLNGAVWIYDTEKSIQGLSANDYFGNSVTITNNGAIVGAYNINTGRGSVFPFWNIGGVWKNTTSLIDLYGSDNDNFGFAVASNGNSLIIGSPYNDNSIGIKAGKVFFYKY